MFKKLILILCVVLGACGLETYQSGDLPELKRLKSIQVGDTQEKVIRVLGTPNYISDKVEGVENLFIYAQTQKESRMFFNPKITSQEVFVYVFDSNNQVKRIAHLTQEDMQSVSYQGSETELGGKQKPIWTELAENFGKYNAGGQDSTIRR